MKVLAVITFSLLLLVPLVSPASAQTATTITADITHNTPPYYEITANTTDGGTVVVHFRWQKTVEWLGFTRTYNTPPILRLSKYNADESLNYSITYMPFYVLEYNDTNQNGLFDLELATHTEWGVDYDFLQYHESVYALYPLTPILPWIFEEESWNWTVTDLVDHPITVDTVDTHQYSWNISATLTSFPWMWKTGWSNGDASTLHVNFRYTVVLYPTGPEVKYDFTFSNVSWRTPDAHLAMESILLYTGEQSPIVKADGWSWKNFTATEHLLNATFTIADEVEDDVLAWAITYENATVDHPNNIQPIAWAIQPTFLIPIGLHPSGTYFDDVAPSGSYKMGFTHQLGLPHFDEYVAQDPVLGLRATLSQITFPPLPSLPGDLLSWTTILTVSVLVTMVYVVYATVGTPRRRGRLV